MGELRAVVTAAAQRFASLSFALHFAVADRSNSVTSHTWQHRRRRLAARLHGMHTAASAGMLCCIRTTVDLPDELLTRARITAAQEGTTLTALLADGLQLRLGKRTAAARNPRPLPVSEAGGGLHPWVDPASNASLLDAADGDVGPA